MAKLSIALSDPELRALRAVLNPKQFKQALHQATVRSTRKGRVMAGDVVRSRLTIRKKFIDSPSSPSAAIKSQVKPGDPTTGSIITRHNPLPLSEFQYTASPSGVSIRIDATRPALTLRHGFKAKVASAKQREMGVSHTGIFTRAKNLQRRIGETYTYRGKKYVIGKNAKGIAWRLPIKESYGPSVFDLISEASVLAPLVQSISTLFRDEIGNQISRFTGGRTRSLTGLVMDGSDTESD